MNVNTIGNSIIMRAWIGSGGCGDNFCCSHMVAPMMIGNAPRCRKSGNSNGINPNRLKMLVGSGADRSWIQP